MIRTSSVRVRLALVVTICFWASAFAAIRRALESYSPQHLALFRFLIATAALTAVACAGKFQLPRRRDLPRILLAGFVGVAVYHCALNYGQRTVTAGAAAFIVNTVPIFTSLLAVLFLHERVTGVHWLGIAVSFSGIALITFGEGLGVHGGPGAWLVLLAAISQSIYFTLQKPLLKTYTAFEVACYTLWSGTAFLTVFLPGLRQEIAEADIPSTLAVIYLGIFPAAFAHVCWTFVLRHLPASHATSYLYAVPPLSLSIGWAWLGEMPTLTSSLGCGLALAGVLIVNRLCQTPASANQRQAANAGRSITLHPATRADLPEVLTANQSALPHLSPLTADGLSELFSEAESFWVARINGKFAGFLIALGPNTAYRSENYRWFDQRFRRFLYIDRIFVSPEARRIGTATELYSAAEKFARERGFPCLACEVNLEPENLISLRFHTRRHFREVSTLRLAEGKLVSLQIKNLEATKKGLAEQTP